MIMMRSGAGAIIAVRLPNSTVKVRCGRDQRSQVSTCPSPIGFVSLDVSRELETGYQHCTGALAGSRMTIVLALYLALVTSQH